MVTVAPLTDFAVSRTEITNWLRLPSALCNQANEVAIFDLLAESATVAIEEFTRRLMVRREVTLRLQKLKVVTQLPWNQFHSLTSFEIDGDEVDPALYELIGFTTPARIVFKQDSLPEITSEAQYPIEIKYIAGEAEDTAGVPAEFKQYALMLIATGYTKRQSIESSNLNPNSMKSYMMELLRNKRVWRYQ